MPEFNHKMQQFNDYKVTLFGSDLTRSRMLGRLEKVFERRRVTDVSADDGTRTIVMRDETVVKFKPRPQNGHHPPLREPFMQMEVRTTSEYMLRSITAMRNYAQDANVPLIAEFELARPEQQRRGRPSRASERPQE